MANKGNSMKSSKDIIDKIEEIQKGLCLLGRNRKTVLSHPKAFELTDDLENKMEEVRSDIKAMVEQKEKDRG